MSGSQREAALSGRLWFWAPPFQDSNTSALQMGISTWPIHTSLKPLFRHFRNNITLPFLNNICHRTKPARYKQNYIPRCWIFIMPPLTKFEEKVKQKEGQQAKVTISNPAREDKKRRSRGNTILTSPFLFPTTTIQNMVWSKRGGNCWCCKNLLFWEIFFNKSAHEGNKIGSHFIDYQDQAGSHQAPMKFWIL